MRQTAKSVPELNDAALLRSQAYVNGAWRAAASAASFVEWFAEDARLVSGDVPGSTWKDKRVVVLKQPIGVCASITPLNFPIAMITRKVAPAIAAGCTIVVKPAGQAPLSTLALAGLAHRAGMPPGVINIVTADAANSVEA